MSRIDEILEARQLKKAHLIERGLDPYPLKPDQPRTLIGALLERFDAAVEAHETGSIMGRIFGLRRQGKLAFLDVRDASGTMQCIVLGELSTSVDDLDIGDIVQISGEAIRSKRGEPSIQVSALRVLSKSLAPLPDTWSGLQDHELRYRQRELDLLMNPDTKRTFELRSLAIESIRTFFKEEGFMEVQTPILQLIAGGTLAEPFATHHHALDIPLYLRIAPEIYLKRLIVGGFERVYELGLSFRNEGIDPQHLQEFTTIEAYQAFASVAVWKERTERLMARIAQDTIGTTTVMIDGVPVDFGKPFPVRPYRNLILDATGIDIAQASDDTALTEAIRSKGITLDVAPSAGWAKKVDELFKTAVRPNLLAPIFVSHYPRALSPLAKEDPAFPGFVDQLQLIIQGHELVKAYSELNDPEEQERQFSLQAIDIAKGDREAHPNDPAFIQSLRIGLPPTAGWALGIDRFLTLLFGQRNIRDVVFFPLMKQE